MTTVDVSTLVPKGKNAALFDKMRKFVKLMDQQRALGANKAHVIKVHTNDYSAMFRMAQGFDETVTEIEFNGYPVVRA
jgi:hypothetical protein